MFKSPRLRAIFEALLVAFLWSTSWVLIKWFLGDIPPLTYAGLRYITATLILLPGMRKYTREVRALKRNDWLRLIALGVIYYAVAQGGQYLALAHLDAITVSLLLNFTTVVVALFSIIFLREIPTWVQWLGLGIFLCGVYLYFQPLTASEGSWLGYLFALMCLGANAIGMVLGRAVRRNNGIHPYVVTVIGMGIGSIIMLSGGLLTAGLGTITWQGALAILWLAAVNTSFGYLLWNKTMEHLTAVEQSNINSTMLIWIAVLAWIFLGERPTPVDIVGLLLSVVGIFMIQAQSHNTIPPDLEILATQDVLAFRISGSLFQQINDWEYAIDERVFKEQLKTESFHGKYKVDEQMLEIMKLAQEEGKILPYYGASGSSGASIYHFGSTPDGFVIKVAHSVSEEFIEINIPCEKVKAFTDRKATPKYKYSAMPHLVSKQLPGPWSQAPAKEMIFRVVGNEYQNLVEWGNWDFEQAFTTRYVYRFGLVSMGSGYTIKVEDTETGSTVDITDYDNW